MPRARDVLARQRSMQAWRLEIAVAVGRSDVDFGGLAVAHERDRHLDPGFAERPDPAEEAGEIADLGAADGEHNVAGSKVGTLRRSALGDPGDRHLVVDLGRIEPEPGSWLAVGATDGPEIAEDWLQEIDRHDHVEVLT